MEKREKMMVRQQRDQWPRSPFLTSLVFLVAISSLLSACGFSAPSTPAQVIHTVYFTGEHGSVDALQSETGRLRWHKQLDNEWSVAGSPVVFGDVLYVGRVICTLGCSQTSSYIGSLY